MFATVTLLTLVNSVAGTPYVSGGDTPRGTDCSGLVSWVANAASGRPIYGDRFNTGNIERALLSRGFVYGSQPGTLNVGWNGGHTAATLPDGTPVSSGEGGGVKVGGGGAFQKQFSHHMYLPMAPEELPPLLDAPMAGDPFLPPPPEMVPPPAPEAPVVLMAGEVPPAPEMAPPAAPEPEMAPPPPPADPFAPPPPADIAPPA
jgi:NlpC/P60 family